MTSTKLQKYLEIIRIIVVHGPLEFTQVQTLLGVGKIDLSKDLVFLIDQKIIQKTMELNGLVTYVASPIDIKIANYFRLTRDDDA